MGKNSFLLYYDWQELFSTLTNEEKGILLSAMFDYQCNGIIFESENKLLQGIFNYIVSRFNSDREKYEATCKKNSENAKKRYENKEN